MWDTARDLLQNHHAWSPLLYLILGAVVGAFLSIRYSIRANRPQLVIDGTGGRGVGGLATWSVAIANRPSFLGQRLAGETAHEVRATLHVKNRPARHHFLFWEGAAFALEPRATIEAGQRRQLRLFYHSPGESGFFVGNERGEPLARFSATEKEFVVRLYDRLDRVSSLSFRVEYDDSHLRNPAEMDFHFPLSASLRHARIKDGLSQIRAAFRLR